MKAHLIDTHLLVLRSSAKVKVKYQDHVSQKMGVSLAFVFHKHILFLLGSLDTSNLDVNWDELFSLPKDYWVGEINESKMFLKQQVGEDLPNEIQHQLELQEERISE